MTRRSDVRCRCRVEPFRCDGGCGAVVQIGQEYVLREERGSLGRRVERLCTLCSIKRCEHCDQPFQPAFSRDPEYCSGACRAASQLARSGEVVVGGRREHFRFMFGDQPFYTEETIEWDDHWPVPGERNPMDYEGT